MTKHEMAGGEAPVDYDYFLNTYGLGPDEVDATVRVEGHEEGTVAEMLQKCKMVGITMAKAYAENGIAGTETTLVKMKEFSGDFNLEIGERTRSFHEGTTDRKSLLSHTPGGSPDFLA